MFIIKYIHLLHWKQQQCHHILPQMMTLISDMVWGIKHLPLAWVTSAIPYNTIRLWCYLFDSKCFSFPSYFFFAFSFADLPISFSSPVHQPNSNWKIIYLFWCPKCPEMNGKRNLTKVWIFFDTIQLQSELFSVG